VVVGPLKGNGPFSRHQIKQLTAGSNFLPFAHHPHCSRHSHHLIWVGGHPLCLGCSSLYSGVPIGIFVSSVTDWSEFGLATWIAIHIAALLPTVVQPFFQEKWFKILSRTLLGVACGSYFFSGMLKVAFFFDNPWIWRSAVIVAFLSLYALLSEWRRRNANDPCKMCPLGQFPTCDWNLPRLLAGNNDDLLIASIISNHEGKRGE